ncbi:MAG TPA: polyprenyl synthetase family protein [Clostridia bacterium]|jgi:geranylgeranyl diphosphate synthase type II|nr:polyprenyl synthetase family protein [Clostridia bacterium]
MDLKQYLQEKAALVNQELERLLPSDLYPPVIHEAMRYSIFAGGKRLRPILCLAAAEAVGRGEEGNTLLPVACALEMAHTYSLIHDDLPAMDNDDYRRGKLTNHMVFGEGLAILAGDALLTYAFEVLLRFARKCPDQTRALQVLEEIAVALGTQGMIGGQVVDLESEGKSGLFNREELLSYIHTHKTGALFRAAIRAGAILAGANDAEVAALTEYAEQFGLAFQITDDLLDITGDEKCLGKPVGSDVKNQKITYPALYGLEESRSLAKKTIEAAVWALTNLPGQTMPLELLVRSLEKRVS